MLAMKRGMGWAEGNLGRRGSVRREEFLQLLCRYVSLMPKIDSQNTDILPAKMIREIGNHNLVLGWNTIGGRSGLTPLMRGLGLGILGQSDNFTSPVRNTIRGAAYGTVTTTMSASTASSGWSTAITLATGLTSTSSTFGLLTGRLWLAGKLNGDLAF
jgi:hypothetical protein